MPEANRGKINIYDLPAEERPLQRLEHYGEPALSTLELLAVVIGTGHADENVLQVAAALLSTVDRLDDLSKRNLYELSKVRGIGPVKAARIKAAIEFGRRVNRPSPDDKIRITSPADAGNLLIPEMSHLDQEHLVTLLLNTRNEVINKETIYKGSLNSAVVRIAEVFRPAIRQNTAAIIVAHNHPAGDPSPSAEDVRITRELVKAGNLLGIGVLDHLIIGRGRFLSLKERSLGFDV